MWMLLLRGALFLVIGMLLVGLIVRGVGTSDTGVVEKLFLVAIGAALLFVASRVHRIGSQRSARLE